MWVKRFAHACVLATAACHCAQGCYDELSYHVLSDHVLNNRDRIAPCALGGGVTFTFTITQKPRASAAAAGAEAAGGSSHRITGRSSTVKPTCNCALYMLELERPMGVYEGDGTLSVHPCHALFVAENRESRSPFSRQSGSYHFVCGSAAPSTRPSSQASALVARLLAVRAHGRACFLPRSCIHLRTHTRAPAQPQQSTQQLSLTWIERLARR